MSCWRISCRINRDIKVLFIFQLSDLGSHVVTPACSFLTVAAGRRSATPASASTDMLAAPRSVISPRITVCDLESTSVSEEQGFTEVFFFSSRWGVVVGPASCPRLRPLLRTRTLCPPALAATSVWSTPFSSASRRRATSGGCVPPRTPRHRCKPSVSPTVVTWTTAVLASH